MLCNLLKLSIDGSELLERDDKCNIHKLMVLILELVVGIVVKMLGGVPFTNMTNNDYVSLEFTYEKIEFK